MSKKISLLIACLVLSLYACRKKEGPQGPQGPAGPQGTTGYYGSIAGHIALYDQKGNEVLHGRDSIKVFLKNGVSATADINGYYHFDSVASGNYNISITCPGYGSTQSGNFALLKDTIYKNLKMTHIPDSNVLSFRINRSGSDFLQVFVPPSFNNSWIVFVSNRSDVSNSNYKLYYKFIAGVNHGTIQIPFADYLSAGIFYGDSIYYAAYSYVNKDYSAYEDLATGDSIFTALGTPMRDTLSAP